MIPSNPFNLDEDEFDMLCDEAIRTSQETIEADFQNAKVTSSLFSSTDKSARLVKQLREDRRPYLSIDGFRRAYEKYEEARVEEEVVEGMERELTNGFATAHMTMRTRGMPFNTQHLTSYQKEAVERGITRRDVPLAFGKTGKLTRNSSDSTWNGGREKDAER